MKRLFKTTRVRLPLLLCLLVTVTVTLVLQGPTLSAVAPQYDVVILHGRVIDPESKLDAVRNIGIANGTIQVITSSSIRGRATIDARGLVVSPGFIDLHEHGQDQENYRYKAMDGVTTALELEVGTGDIDQWYASRQGEALINYGASIGHIPVRMSVMHDPGSFLPTGDAAHRVASDSEIEAMKREIEKGLRRGALGVGFGINYTAAAARWEILEMFRVAAAAHAPCFVHLRFAGLKEPTSGMAALEEAIALAASTGAPLHVVHITSIGLRGTPDLLRLIAAARSRGMDITTECYPYTATQTLLESAIYDEGWREALGIDYKDLQWVATGERLTAETFAKYRKTGGIVIGHSIPEEIARLAIADPIVMIASDGLISEGKGHPRGSGTYARVLGKYVREEKVISLGEALRRMTLMPAQRLEGIDPAMKKKGRIRVGADADLTVFDPARVIDKSTYERPAEFSEGMEYVLVGGMPVVEKGKLREGTSPGRPVRAPIH
jgi:N-acyl-D-aspartate/D-glutamate deacylase